MKYLKTIIKIKQIKLNKMKNIYDRIFGEEFMNSPVQGTKEEAKFIEQKLNEFRKKQEMDISILKKINNLK